MKLKPLFDRVVAEPIQENEKTKGGIILPSSNQEKPQVAKVISIGNGITIDGETTPMQVKVGDTIVYSKYAGSEFKNDDGKTLILLRQTEILALLEN